MGYKNDTFSLSTLRKFVCRSESRAMLLLVIVVLALLAFWRYLLSRNNIFKRIGINGPKPDLLFGNLLEVYKTYGAFTHPLVSVNGKLLQIWTKKFGKVYGYFEGGTPIMVMSDPDMVSEVFVKQFSNFHGRKLMIVQTNPDTSPDVNMFLARGTRWKRIRNISNPTFSSMKMKQMYPIISNCVDELISVLDEKAKNGEPFDIHAVFQGLTLDVIARTAFGYQTSVQSNPNDELLKLCRGTFEIKRSFMTKIILNTLIVLPELRPLIVTLMQYTARLRKRPVVFIKDRMQKVMEERKKQKGANEGIKDFIQLMLEAETSEDFDISDEAQGLEMKNVHVEKRLTANEIVAQSFLFIVAGYETTSTALGCIVYVLSLYPDIQEKVYQEIENTISQGHNISYDTVQKLTYMDLVIHETLRLYPFAQSVVNRLCMKPCTVNGVHIPEGMNVFADVLSLHFNEDLWGPDAIEFNPDRFLPENSKGRHPMAYMPFGAGPRNCIGMRFALLEAKLALCKVLQKYKIKSCEKTKFPKKLEQPSIYDAAGDVYVILEERSK